MNTARLRRGAAICGVILGLAGCTVYQEPQPYYAGGYQQPAPAPAPYYYAPAPAYAYPAPVYAGPSIGLGLGFDFGGGGHGGHHWR